MNSRAIADAIAGCFTGVTSTAGEPLTSPPTASLPNAVSRGPVLLVYHPSGSLDLEMGPRRNDELDFPVKLLRDPMDVAARSDALYAWYDSLRDKVEANFDLDLAYVAWARCVGVRIQLDGETYAGGIFDVIELTVRVHLSEIVSSVHI